MVIGLNLHLTTLTAALVRELALGGGEFVVSAANPATTDPGTVDLLRNLGFQVYTGGDMADRHRQVLEHEPDLLVDVGFELVQTLLDRNPERAAQVKGAVEITRTGILRLQAVDRLPFPVVNINDGRLKPAVENRHGVGTGLWQAVTSLTGMHLAGGRCGDTQVLSEAALAQMYADGLAPFGGVTILGGGYGMGWWIDRDTGRLTDPGAYGSVPWLDLEDGYGAYLVIERDSTTGAALAAQLFDPVERAVLGE